MDDSFIVIDIIEEAQDDKGKTYLKVTDKAGVTRNIKEGRNNLLTNKGHLLKEGVAIKLHFQDYRTPDGKVFPFVRDFELVENVFEQEAIKKVQAQQGDTRNRSMSLSYAKDIGISRDWLITTILQTADIFYCWLETGRISNETTKTKDDKPETKQELPPTATAVTVKNAGDLMRWALSHGKEFNASFVRREANIPPNEIITEEKVKEAYKLIKEKMKWED